MEKMKILAFMQNQWVRNPDAVKAMFARHPDRRNDLIKRLLFLDSVSGKRLRAAFGDLCDIIVWEEASPMIADHSSSVFKADLVHIKDSIKQHQPKIVLCFGKIAGDAVRSLSLPIYVLYAPHPAARGYTLEALKYVAEKFKKELSEIT